MRRGSFNIQHGHSTLRRERAERRTRLAAHFAKLWSAVAIELPLWEGGGRESSRRRSKHHTLPVVTIPPPSQSGGFATALQSTAHEMAATHSVFNCSAG